LRSIEPQLAAGGGLPRPRYASPASAIRTPAIPKVAATSNGDRTFGRIRRARIRCMRLPDERDASTNGSSRTASVTPRTRRVSPNTNTIDSDRMTYFVSRPRMPATASASTSGGNASPPSTTRISALSVLPPTKPENNPITRLTTIAITITETATCSEIQAP
jgi:hypothetical protein